MHFEPVLTHDVHNFYLRWEIRYEGREREVLSALGGPVALDVETSCLVDPQGNRHETAHVKVVVWPHPGPKNVGQARFYDVDSRRRFVVNVGEAIGAKVVDEVFSRREGSIGKEGLTVSVPEYPRGKPAVSAPGSTATR